MFFFFFFFFSSRRRHTRSDRDWSSDVCSSDLRLYGRAPRGQRATESVPRNYGPQTSIISAVSLKGAEATMTIEGAVDTDTFNAYIEQVLRPTIQRGDVLVLDNLSAHRASRLEDVAGE